MVWVYPQDTTQYVQTSTVLSLQRWGGAMANLGPWNPENFNSQVRLAVSSRSLARSTKEIKRERKNGLLSMHTVFL